MGKLISKGKKLRAGGELVIGEKRDGLLQDHAKLLEAKEKEKRKRRLLNEGEVKEEENVDSQAGN